MPDTYNIFSAADSLRQPQSFSGTDVKVVFSIPGTSPAYLANNSNLQSVQLQTITMSSATSVFPIRRMGEARASAYNKGPRTFAGSMVFSILGEDPLQKIFAIDPIKSAARTDAHWHIDQMPAMDCLLMFGSEHDYSARGMQVIQDMHITNWGETVSIDDMYVETTYTYIAEHVTPFLNSTSISNAASANEVMERLGTAIDQLYDRSLTPDDALLKAVDQLQQEDMRRYGRVIYDILGDIFNRYHASHVLNRDPDIGLQDAVDGTFPSTSSVFAAFQPWDCGPEVPYEVFNFPRLV